MFKKLCIIVLSLIALSADATHWMGGEITWECQGSGNYIFQLRIYRDCNGVAGPNTAQLNVWNHPGLTSIPLNLISQSDISPACNQVAGGPAPITCAAGGAGAVEEFVFESAAISITGIPPAQGWVFTWDGFSRNPAIQNITNPSSYGITLRAVMYAYNGQNAGPCFDSSPKFAEAPATVLCTGYPFRYNQNAFDPDLDSLAFSFGEPLDDLNGQYNPGVDPIVLPYEPNYSVNSPLPGTAHHPSNVPAAINPYTGEVSFTSFTQGNFVTVVKVESWRCGQKIAEVYRELQIVLLGCGINNPPVINAPFPGNSFSDTVYAGDIVNFTFSSTDVELLQDGSPQSNILIPSGSQFGANFNNAGAGCPNPPCAVLSDPIPLTGTQGVSTDFTWQTDCSHVTSASGCAVSNTHTFVFKVADDFCPAPGTAMPTVSITVLSLPEVGAPQMNCASVAPNGDVTINWTAPPDPTNSFVNYEIWSAASQGGPYTLVGTTPNINATSFTHIGVDAQNGSHFYYVKTVSGCGGAYTSEPSDTIQTILLDVLSSNGMAQLSWNPIATPSPPSSEGWYMIWMEYPVGTWNIIDSVPYGQEDYDHIISICSDTITFRVEIGDTTGCTSVSSTAGDWFTDVTSPEIPIISYVTVDTATGYVDINWNVNADADTEGYIIMMLINGQWIPIDTVWGIGNVNYVDSNSNANNGIIQYGVLAFDSCWSGNPLSPNTSALGATHQTMFLQSQLSVCDREVLLTWNEYAVQPVDQYEIYARIGLAPAVLIGTVPAGTTSFVHQNVSSFANYTYVVKALFTNITGHSLSNISNLTVYQPPAPNFTYLQTATVVGENEIDIRMTTDLAASVSHYAIMRADESIGPYDEIGIITPGGANPMTFTDINVETTTQSYFYQIAVIDSCGDTAMVSNYGKTMLLGTYAQSDSLVNIITWTAYEIWDGSVAEYRLYRSVDGVFDPTPIAVFPPNLRAYQDDVSDLLQDARGDFCYYVEAVEHPNTYGFSESAFSNVACAYQEPKFWIPNAIVVGGGFNEEFKPVAGYINYTTYEFYVYNRWGQQIFFTGDVEEGWDGTFKGKPVAAGVYVYHFIFKGADGQDIEHRGPVTVIYSDGN